MENKIIKGDCLEVMKDIPDGSVDCVITDLPYGTTACKWDKVIPLDELWKQYKRILKEDGVVVLTASQPFTTDLINSNREWFKYCWIWKKTKPTGFSHSKNMPLKDYEDIVIFSPASIGHINLIKNRMKYNPQGVCNLKRNIKRNKKGFEGTMERESQVNEYVGELSGFPKMIIEFNNVLNGTVHPTQKPVALFEYLIKTYTNEGDLVLDNCAGSGTTGVACKNLNRNFILIEKEEKYIKVIEERLGQQSATGFTQNSTSFGFATQNSPNKDLEVSATPTPKESQKVIPSLNPDLNSIHNDKQQP